MEHNMNVPGMDVFVTGPAFGAGPGVMEALGLFHRANAAESAGDFAEADRLYRECPDLRLKDFKHVARTDIETTLLGLADTLAGLRQVDGAEKVCREALAMGVRADSPEVPGARKCLSDIQDAQRAVGEGEAGDLGAFCRRVGCTNSTRHHCAEPCCGARYCCRHSQATDWRWIHRQENREYAST